MRLRDKFFLFISLLILLVIGALLISSSHFLNQAFLDNNEIYSSNLTDQLATSIYFVTGHFEEKIRRMIDGFLPDENLSVLTKFSLDTYESTNMVDEFFHRLLYPPIGLQDIYLISDKGEGRWNSNRFDRSESYHLGVIESLKGMVPLIKSYWGEFYWFSLPGNRDCLYLAVALYRAATIDSQIVVVAGISREYLESFFQGYNADLGGDLIIYNRERDRVYASRSAMSVDVFSALDERVAGWEDGEIHHSDFIEVKGNRYHITWDSFRDKRLIICHILSIAKLKEPTRVISRLLISLGGAALLLSLLLSYFLANLITHRITMLHRQIDFINRGHLDARISLIGSDEIGQLGEAFNEMTSQLNVTLKRLAEEEVSLKEMELRAVQSEYKALQSQINPHFLYNTLESINSLAKMEGQERIETLVSSLARLLRNSLKSGESLHPLRKEIDYVKDYLTIQEQLQENRWQVVWEIDEKYWEQPIPRFTLQPLVENAVNHGMGKIKREGLIMIHTIEGPPGRFFLEVSDNGGGIGKDQLARLHDLIDSGEDSEHHGLLSVHRRLRLLWGEGFGLVINSDGETGTTCRLILLFGESPCIEC